MAFPRFRREAIAFPSPYPNRDVYYPHPHLYHDYRRDHYNYPDPPPREERAWRKADAIAQFLDDSIAYSGDLGWTLDYATAWCYRHLIGSQPEVADTIDHVRELDNVSPKTPYYIFDYLDKAIFGGKLQGMVYLRWKSQSSCSTGTTSAPNVIPGIPRICVELNMTPFEDDEADIDDLLEALIHQMIHAYFLVCCGAQKKDDHQDGRLMDGLHFGVILLTIKDITKQCADGVLSMVFHAHRRREYEGRLPLPPANVLVGHQSLMPCTKRGNSYISLDPRGSAVGSAAADGQTHCMHDNRKISWQQIKNWQVETYARAIDLQMDLKGLNIWDLDADGVLVPHSRLRVDPSTTYVELLWDEKRIMIPRSKCLEFPSLERPITKLGQFDLLIPRCSFATFKCIYDFIQQGTYLTSEYEVVRRGAPRMEGLPIYKPPQDGEVPSGELPSIIANIEVFKAAEAMKFEEMQYHALSKLWHMDVTGDDPIEAFRELYNTRDPDLSPVHSELHKWARKFMLQKDDGLSNTVRQRQPYRISHHGLDDFFDQDPYTALYHGQQDRGLTNYEKIRRFHGPAFEELYGSNGAFRDDADIVKKELILNSNFGHDEMHFLDSFPSLSSGISSLSSLSSLGLVQPGLRLPHRRSWSSCGDHLDLPWQVPRLQRSFDDFIINPHHHDRRQAAALPMQQRLLKPAMDFFGRGGRPQARNFIFGDKFGRAPAHQWREDLRI